MICIQVDSVEEKVVTIDELHPGEPFVFPLYQCGPLRIRLLSSQSHRNAGSRPYADLRNGGGCTVVASEKVLRVTVKPIEWKLKGSEG